MFSTTVDDRKLGLSQASSESPDFRVAFVEAVAESGAPEFVSCKSRKSVRLDHVPMFNFLSYLESSEESIPLAAIFVFSEDRGNSLNLVSHLRQKNQFCRTRVYIVSSAFGKDILFGHSLDGKDSFDIERVIDSNQFNLSNQIAVASALELAIDAYRSVESNPLMPDYYLDATYQRVFDWFESTRWDWSELDDFSNIQKELVTPADLEILKESAIIEFGTLPGAHNFLREWIDDYSFSSWALSWGAEESRHSLVQCRYLRSLGVDIRAKHAMYKRQPYPIGENQAGTLMMNIISESRAAEYYLRLSKTTQEPVLKKIWKLLGQDEARHARAFFIFCKELCEASEANLLESLKMAYVWLADRDRGVKHPAGHFFPHSSSADGLREIEGYYENMTDRADARVYEMCKKLAGDDSINSPRDLKRVMRGLI